MHFPESRQKATCPKHDTPAAKPIQGPKDNEVDHTKTHSCQMLYPYWLLIVW